MPIPRFSCSIPCPGASGPFHNAKKTSRHVGCLANRGNLVFQDISRIFPWFSRIFHDFSRISPGYFQIFHDFPWVSRFSRLFPGFSGLWFFDSLDQIHGQPAAQRPSSHLADQDSKGVMIQASGVLFWARQRVTTGKKTCRVREKCEKLGEIGDLDSSIIMIHIQSE